MVRVSIGDGWRSDPAVREALARAGEPRSRSAAVRSIVDVLTIEVDGVDIAAGRTEGPVVAAAAALGGALRRLSSGASHATVPFPDGAVDLVLRRRGGSVLLSLVTLSRPARVLAQDVEVDLAALVEAAREATSAWCRRVVEVAPDAAQAPALRRLLRPPSPARASRRETPEPFASPPEPPRARRPARRPRAPVCSFELHDRDGRLADWRGPGGDLASLLVPGRVALRSAGNRDLLAVSGVPFLLLRDLCAAAERVVAGGGHGVVEFALARPGRQPPLAVEVDLARGTLAVGGGEAVACEPLALARALLEGAADFCAVVASRAPAQEANAQLADLREAARSGLALVREIEAGERAGARRRLRGLRERSLPAAPLAPGRLRRVTFQHAPLADLGAPADPPLLAGGGRLLLAGSAASVALDGGTDGVAWRGPGAERACLAEGTAVLLRQGELVALDAATGAERWRREVPGHLSVQGIRPAPGARVALLAPGHVEALELSTGRRAWSLEAPGALRLHASRVGPLLLVAADTGLVQALDAGGRCEWRLRGAGPLAQRPALAGGRCLLLFRTPLGASLASVDAARGQRAWETALDLAPTGPPVPFAGRVAVAGSVGGDPVVAAIDPDGTPAWSGTSSPGPGPVALAPLAGGLAVKTADGSCASLDRDGNVRWTRSREGASPAPGNLPPVAARGLLLVPSEDVEVLDEASGLPVGRLAAPTPARLHVGDDLRVVGVDADGLAWVARLRTHLSVVR